MATAPAVLRASGLCQRGPRSWALLPNSPNLRPGSLVSPAPARMDATVTLEPASRCCWDEPVRITVRGLAPEQQVTLRASLRDEKGELFWAHAHYCADAGGELDLMRAPALGGSFTGLEPMGLFWALEPEKPLVRLVKRDVQTPFIVELEVLEGHEPQGGRLLGRAVHQRDFLAPGVQRVPVRTGRVRATLFLPPGEGPFPGILDLFGSSGGLCEYRASLLAGHGFAVLALAYFKFEDLPKYLQEVHLEYFEEAVDFMLQHPKVKGPGVGLLGFSKGGDLCLSMASFLKGISATVVINTCVANTLAPLHYKDMIIPDLGNDLRKSTTTESGFLDFMNIWSNPLEEPCRQSLIPLEKAQGPFLFIVGLDDRSWNSEFYAHIASERLQAHGKERPQIIYCPGTGHCIDPPYFPPSTFSVHSVLDQAIIYGGEPKAHSRAQVDVWQQIQIFFHKHVNGKKSVKLSKM